MSQGASDAGRNSTAHCTMRNLTRARVCEQADCGRALTGGENARAQGLFSRASLTRNVTLLNLELGPFFPLSLFSASSWFSVVWTLSRWSESHQSQNKSRGVKLMELSKTLNGTKGQSKVLLNMCSLSNAVIIKLEIRSLVYGKCIWIYLKFGHFTDTWDDERLVLET